MLQQLLSIDRSLFLRINSAHCGYADFIFYWASDRFIWIPFYALLLFVLYKHYGKKAFWLLPIVAVLILGCDQLANFLKFSVQRFRPCHEQSLQGMLHLVNGYCGGDYGFVSSHAANSMGLLVFMWRILPSREKIMRIALLGYVLLIAYSRIYLAAHYPGDILGGWLIGLLLGYGIAAFANQKIKLTSMQHG